MSTWKQLLQREGGDVITLPWIGGRELRSAHRTFSIFGELPKDHGWYTFKLNGRRAEFTQPRDGTEPTPEMLAYHRTGYLVGDRFATDQFDARVVIKPEDAGRALPRVHLVTDDLGKFVRIRVGQIHSDGPLIYYGPEMPLGPEPDVFLAWEDRLSSIDHIKGVTPALDAAFRLETQVRAETERRRAELERLRREEEERRAREEQRAALVRQLGDGAGRREMAKVDFEAAARAALAIGGAELLSWQGLDRRYGGGFREFIVRFRLDGERHECLCDQTMHIIHAGICLEDHRTHERGDDRFTLESLPAVVREATRLGRLVRVHVG